MTCPDCGWEYEEIDCDVCDKRFRICACNWGTFVCGDCAAPIAQAEEEIRELEEQTWPT